MPVTAAVIGVVAAVAGTAMSVYSSVQQGNAQRNAADAQANAARQAGAAQSASYQSQAEAEKYNADINRQNADYIKQAGAIEEEKQRKQGRRLLGTQQALYGKAGVTNEGTPLEIMASTAADLEKDALTTRYNYDIQSRKQLSEAGSHDFMANRNLSLGGFAVNQANASADAYTEQGAYASSAGYMKAGTSLLTGLGSVANIYSGMKVPTVGTSGYDYKPGGYGFKNWT